MKNNGFTLIELLVVISIIGLLSALLLTNFVGIRERAADSKAKSDVNQLKNAMRLYYNDYQQFPDGSGQSSFLGCGATGTSVCTNGGAFQTTSSVYMKAMPVLSAYDNLDGDRDNFVACVELENEGDSDLASSKSACGLDTATSEPAVEIGPEDYCVCSE